jgi:hypothetical protein
VGVKYKTVSNSPDSLFPFSFDHACPPTGAKQPDLDLTNTSTHLAFSQQQNTQSNHSTDTAFPKSPKTPSPRPPPHQPTPKVRGRPWEDIQWASNPTPGPRPPHDPTSFPHPLCSGNEAFQRQRRAATPCDPTSTPHSDVFAPTTPPNTLAYIYALTAPQPPPPLISVHCSSPLHSPDRLADWWDFFDTDPLWHQQLPRLRWFAASGDRDQHDTARNFIQRLLKALDSRSTAALGTDTHGPHIHECVACSIQITRQRRSKAWRGHDVYVMRAYENARDTVAAWSDQIPPAPTRLALSALYTNIMPAGWYDDKYGCFFNQLHPHVWREEGTPIHVCHAWQNGTRIIVDRPPQPSTGNRSNLPEVDGLPQAIKDADDRISRHRAEETNFPPELHTRVGLKVTHPTPTSEKLRTFLCETGSGLNPSCPSGCCPSGSSMFHTADDAVGLIRSRFTWLLTWDIPKAFHSMPLQWRYRDYCSYSHAGTGATLRSTSADFGGTWCPLLMVIANSDEVGRMLLNRGIDTVRVMDNFLCASESLADLLHTREVVTNLCLDLGINIHEIEGPAQVASFYGSELRPIFGQLGLSLNKQQHYLLRVQHFWTSHIAKFMDSSSPATPPSTNLFDTNHPTAPLGELLKIIGMLAWMAPNYSCGKHHVASGWALAWGWPEDDQPFRVHKDIIIQKGLKSSSIEAVHDSSLSVDLSRPIDLTGHQCRLIFDLHWWLFTSPSHNGVPIFPGQPPNGGQRDNRNSRAPGMLSTAGRFTRGPPDSVEFILKNNCYTSLGQPVIFADASKWGRAAHTVDDQLIIIQHRSTDDRNINLDERRAMTDALIHFWGPSLTGGPANPDGFHCILGIGDSQMNSFVDQKGYSRDYDLDRRVASDGEQFFLLKIVFVYRWTLRYLNTKADKFSKENSFQGHTSTYVLLPTALLIMEKMANCHFTCDAWSDPADPRLPPKSQPTSICTRSLSALDDVTSASLNNENIIVNGIFKHGNKIVDDLLRAQDHHLQGGKHFRAFVLLPHPEDWTPNDTNHRWQHTLADRFALVGTLPQGSKLFKVRPTRVFDDELDAPFTEAGPTPWQLNLWELRWPSPPSITNSHSRAEIAKCTPNAIQPGPPPPSLASAHQLYQDAVHTTTTTTSCPAPGARAPQPIGTAQPSPVARAPSPASAHRLFQEALNTTTTSTPSPAHGARPPPPALPAIPPGPHHQRGHHLLPQPTTCSRRPSTQPPPQSHHHWRPTSSPTHQQPTYWTNSTPATKSLPAPRATSNGKHWPIASPPARSH